MPERVFDADIVVAGAGPSGLVTACEAALGGASVIVLEKRDGPTWSRAGTLAPRVMELLASRGLADTFMARALELNPNPRSVNGIWAGLGPIRYERLDSDYKWILIFPQLETEKLLAQHFRSLGGDLRLKSEVLGLAQDPDGVDVRFRDPDGIERLVRGRYLVGADGNRSAVRDAAGIGRTGTPAKRIAVNVDALVPNPYPQPLTVAHDRNGWAMTYPLREGVTRFAFIDAASMHEPPDRPLGLEEAKAMLRRVHGTDYGTTEVDAINRFHDALFLADRIRDRRLFLVGESVRVHYPASGVGMNFCIQDAFNLGWKLAAAATGRAADWLLDTYSAERLPEIHALLDDVRRQCALQFNFDDDHFALKRFFERDVLPNPALNLKICENLAGTAAAYPSPDGSPAIVGRRLPNLPLRSGGGVFDLLRPAGFVLLDLTGRGSLPVAARDVRLSVASADPGARPMLEGIETLLLRPDGHVAWASRRSLADGSPDAEIRAWLNLPSSAAVLRPGA